MINFFYNYANDIYDAAHSVDRDAVYSLYNEIVVNIVAGTPIYTFGNGGSAAIAEHLTCDFNKGIYTDVKFKMHFRCLSSNIPTITAIANDIGYDEVFSKQLEYYHDSERITGLAIAISSSGNSPNIVKGLETARKLGIKTAALVGFDGGIVAKYHLADILIHASSNNYGITEDVHMMIAHSIAQNFRRTYCLSGTTPKL